MLHISRIEQHFLQLVHVFVLFLNLMLEATDNTILDKGAKKDSADKKKKEASSRL